jgi:leucyl aminopeptidase
MEIAVEGGEALDSGTECAVFLILEREGKSDPLPPVLAAADKATGGLIAAAWERNEIKGKKGEATFHPMPGGKKRIVILGLGKKGTNPQESVRLAGGYLARALKGKGIGAVTVQLPCLTLGRLDPADGVKAFADGLFLGAYEFNQYKSEKGEPSVSKLVVALTKKNTNSRQRVAKALDWEKKIIDSVIWARDTGNLPADVATPEYLAGVAEKLGAEKSLKVTIFDENQLKEMGCGGILGVGQGSDHPPRMVVLEYPGIGKKAKTVAVVGKGITFDSGGISIKPAANMAEMKFDKSGAVNVLGIMRAVADLKLPTRVIGIMGLAENLPGGKAYRPGDVVKAFNGKTIEILNTDAEGRVVLADALSYAAGTYHPDEIIDMATLTGACVVALGNDTAGLFSNDDGLAKRLAASSEATGEKVWRMPLTQVHKDMVRGEVGDVRNSTEMPVGGALTAAAFLSEFVGDTHWVHLDIAGPAYVGKAGSSYVPSYHPSGYVAFGVRLLTHYLTNPK